MGANIEKLVEDIIENRPKTIEFEYLKKDKVVARVYVDVENNRVEQEMFTDNILDVPIPNPKKNIETLMYFFETRCFPRTRANAKQLLNDLGLDAYNPYDIVKVTRGRLWDDYYWIRFKGDEATFEDIKLRD